MIVTRAVSPPPPSAKRPPTRTPQFLRMVGVVDDIGHWPPRDRRQEPNRHPLLSHLRPPCVPAHHMDRPNRAHPIHDRDQSARRKRHRITLGQSYRPGRRGGGDGVRRTIQIGGSKGAIRAHHLTPKTIPGNRPHKTASCADADGQNSNPSDSALRGAVNRQRDRRSSRVARAIPTHREPIARPPDRLPPASQT